VLFCYPFRYGDELTGCRVKPRYKAEPCEIAMRHAEWEINGEPEYRRQCHAEPLGSLYQVRARSEIRGDSATAIG